MVTSNRTPDTDAKGGDIPFTLKDNCSDKGQQVRRSTNDAINFVEKGDARQATVDDPLNTYQHLQAHNWDIVHIRAMAMGDEHGKNPAE